MHVIKKKTLVEFWKKHADARVPLTAWFHEAKIARWETPQDIKARYRSADFLSGNRVVFNIGGNKYRLVVKIAYSPGLVYIRFVGTHAEYDKIDVETV
jgi:mRNA interferase HigB